MKALNRPSRFAQIAAPKDAPRISRKRLWYDRNEWRKAPEVTRAASESLIDTAMHNDRNLGTLEDTNYGGLTDLANRAGRAGIRRL